ncbi:unnamed protein product [Symbiodinium sp. CCMP2592]|nr:unnamed protein product [Symbiodinium sp. CCMP2592]
MLASMDPGSDTPAAATLDEVGDVRLEFGDDPESIMLASSHLLRLVSPVFNHMLQSGMKEAQQSVIKVDVASKVEFEVFYDLLLPMAWSTEVTEQNVDSLLAISDYYQVESIKQKCESRLLRLPPTGFRVMQAHKYGLKQQYLRCVGALAESSTKEDLELLRQSEPDILLEVALRKQDVLKPLLPVKRMRKEIAKCKTALDKDKDSDDDDSDTAADSTETPTAATLEQVGDVRLEFGDDAGSFMLASSHLLRLASPVFNRMLQSGMREAQQSVIKVDVASKEEFITFYSLLGLWAWSADKVTEENVDSLLAISDYYQVDIIKQACEDLLLTLPHTGARLLQAKKHRLERQYLRCADAVAKFSTKEDLEVLRQSDPAVLLEVALKMQTMLDGFMNVKDTVAESRAKLWDIMLQSEALKQLMATDERVIDALHHATGSILRLHYLMKSCSID